MEIQSALLCDYAQVREGLLFVSSGGITRIGLPSLPSGTPLFLAVIVECGPDEIALTHEMNVTVAQQSSAEVLGKLTGAFQAQPVDLNAGETLQVPVVLPLHGVPLKESGCHDVRVSVDGEMPKILTFYVIAVPGAGSI